MICDRRGVFVTRNQAERASAPRKSFFTMRCRVATLTVNGPSRVTPPIQRSLHRSRRVEYRFFADEFSANSAAMRYNEAMLQALLTPRLFRPRLVAAFLALMLFAPPTDARAQNIISDFFGGLFGGGRNHHVIERSWPEPRRPRESAPMRRIVPHSTSRARLFAPRHADREDAAFATRRRLHRGQPRRSAGGRGRFLRVVMGDTLGDMLADGLEEAFEDIPEIGVLHKSKESSGLVRTDFYDWPKTAQEIANAPRKPDVAVMMVGSNDHQPLGDGAQAVDPFSPRWREVYTAGWTPSSTPSRKRTFRSSGWGSR